MTLAGTVVEVQEHDDTADQEQPQRDRAVLDRTSRAARQHPAAAEGFTADRALYNVVRGSDVGNANVLAAFGSGGYFCSAAAKPFIEQAGFKQLSRRARAASAVQPTQSATSNFTWPTCRPPPRSP